MSAGAICFTSSSSNGGCWVVLVPPLPAFLEKGFFFSYATYAKKQVYRTYAKKKVFVKTHDLHQKESYMAYAKKKPKAAYAYFCNRATLSSMR